MQRSLFRSLLPLLTLFLVTVSAAQAPVPPAQAAEPMAAGMPNPPAQPTKVKCAVLILNIINIDDVNESFEAEIALMASWKDPRLAFDPAIEGTKVKLFQGSYQFNELFTGWWPQLVFLNEVGQSEPNAITVRVFPDGSVRYREQRYIQLETPMDLHKFPFDTQKLKTTMIPFAYASDKVQLEVDEEYEKSTNAYVTKNNQVNVAGWILKDLSMSVNEQSLSSKVRNDSFSQLMTTITLKRQGWQLVWAILFPLLVLVMVVMSVFWVETEALHDRLNISFIGVLTIVAYQFVVMEDLPSMSYLTFTDAMLLVSFLAMALTIPQTLVVHMFLQKGNPELATRIDNICRWGFPLAYLACMTLMAWGYGIL